MTRWLLGAVLIGLVTGALVAYSRGGALVVGLLSAAYLVVMCARSITESEER